MAGWFCARVYEDQQGQVWVGMDRGLLRFRNGHLEPVGAVTGLGQVTVTGIIEDRQGALWIGAQGLGLARLDRAWTTYTTADGLASDGIQALTEWDGRLVVGTARGVSRRCPTEGGGVAWEGLFDGDVSALRPSRRGLLCLRDQQPCLVGPDGTLLSINLIAGLTTSFAERRSDLHEDAEGRVYVASTGHGLASPARAA